MGLGKDRSIDTAGGWKNHLKRIARWKERSLSALASTSSCDIHDAADTVLAYFVWCHSFRDWLLQTKAIDRQTLDSKLSNYPDWKVCRDIANRCRHYELTHNPSDKYWSMAREYDFWASVEKRPEKHLLFLVFGDQKLSVTDVIHSTFKMWNEVLEETIRPVDKSEVQGENLEQERGSGN
ncbi:hypothetical protein [Shinella sp.]|uniref:hypothetical protein n=1 Tax=Shinella sp. TaxID=1870904 RepID=UPI0029BC3B7D|nr:hypothetical protein [Shinella sp.]MDX3973488.1 hypothetical protein [Shinella sp.]